MISKILQLVMETFACSPYALEFFSSFLSQPKTLAYLNCPQCVNGSMIVPSDGLAVQCTYYLIGYRDRLQAPHDFMHDKQHRKWMEGICSSYGGTWVLLFYSSGVQDSVLSSDYCFYPDGLPSRFSSFLIPPKNSMVGGLVTRNCCRGE